MDSTSLCFVPGCSNSEENVTDATFHEFPEDLQLQEEWLTAIDRGRDTCIEDELVCSEHFESTDFENYDSIKTLKQNSIPTLNLPVRLESQVIFEMASKMANDTFKDPKRVCNLIRELGAWEKNEMSEDSGSLQNVELSIHDSEDESVPDVDVVNCRTCLCDIVREEGHPITEVHHESKTLREMIIICIPQMASTLLDTDVVCSECRENIKFCLGFIENCLKIDADILHNNVDQVPMTPSENGSVDDVESSSTETCSYVFLDHNYAPVPGAVRKKPERETSKSVPPSASHECDKCERVFRSENYLLDHIRKVHSAEESDSKKKKMTSFDCDFCDKSFLTKLGYDLHLQLSHRDQVQKRKESGLHACKECGLNFTTSVSLKEHKHKEHGFTCTDCSSSFKSEMELHLHNKTHLKPHLCHVCGKGFRTEAYLKTHIPTHSNPNTLLCHKCGRGFNLESSLRLHIKSHDPDARYLCDQCPSVFRKKIRLETHKKVKHLGIQEYMCSICNKAFCYKSNLMSHYRLKHSEVKRFQCEQCGVRFPRGDYLRRHRCKEPGSKKKARNHVRRNKHRYKTDLGHVTCRLCDKTFKDIQMLRLHIKTHTTLRKYKCGFCNLSFTTSNNLGRHEKVHQDVLRLFRCDICYQRMETQEALDEHCVTSHEFSKKYMCHVCKELFARKYLLHCHLAEKHGDEEECKREEEILIKVILQDYIAD